MARIKIKDLPKDMKISREEMKNITGGISTTVVSTVTTLGGQLSPLDSLEVTQQRLETMEELSQAAAETFVSGAEAAKEAQKAATAVLKDQYDAATANVQKITS
jgi:hypothetical protein